MEGKINVKETTHNTIFVTWNSLNWIQQDNRERISPPFTFTIDGCPVSFALSIKWGEEFVIRVHQNPLRVGRGIVLVAVREHYRCRINVMKTYFIKKWEETCTFNNLGYLMKQDHNLIIDCKMIWLKFVNNIESSNPPVSSSAVASTFSDNKVFPDFTIIAEAQEIPSHKAILARHSSVFSTMFETPMKELKENKVIIEDIECSTMEILLKIIYTGNAEDLTDVDVISKVLHAAEKYQISTIKSLCECKLQLLIDEKNVLEFLKIGDKYNALELCETCIAYIVAIKDEKISMEFQQLSKEMLNIGSVTAKVLIELASVVSKQNI